MDRKAVILLLVFLAALGLLNFVIVPKYFPPVPAPPPSTNTVAALPQGAATNPAVTTTPQVPAVGPTAAPKPAFSTNTVETTMVVTNENGRYTFTSHGGGLKQVELVRYRETVSRAGKKLPLTNGVATLNRYAPAPVLAVLGEGVQDDGIFSLTRTASGVRAEKDLANGLRLVKEFHLSTNYLINATVRMENTSGKALTLPPQEWVVGMAAPMASDDPATAANLVGLMWYDGSRKQEITGGWFENRSFGCFPGTPHSEYRAGTSNVVWASSHNQFFTLVAMPREPALQVQSRPVELPRAEFGASAKPSRNGVPKGFLTTLAYPGVTLQPGAVIERQINFFAGPKEYKTLARIAERFQNGVDEVMGFSMFPFYGIGAFFGKGLLVCMNGLHNVSGLPYGWVIITITIIIKLLFWPLTAASTRSMKRMAALQPQMKALQEKYKGDPAKLNKKMMEFWKEHKVNPMGGCLPMLLQMPVFFGFFTMIRTAIELRGESWLWVADLAKSDTLFTIPGITFIPFISSEAGLPFNLLPLLMGGTMLWQSHLTPPSPSMDPVQQKMMRYMPLMFLLFLYNYSSGLALYWTVNNLLSILQTKLTKSNEPAHAVAGPVTSPALTPASKKKK